MKKFRLKYGELIVEGEKIVSELLDQNPEQVRFVICRSEQQDIFADRAHVLVASSTEMAQMSQLKNPSKFIALVKMAEEKNITPIGWSVLLENIQDPGNLGTILRTAEWFGIKSIIYLDTHVDYYNNKVVQSSMGSVFRMTHKSYESLELLRVADQRNIYTLDLSGNDIQDVSFPQDGILAFGNEGNGISPVLKAESKHQIHIPKFGNSKVESLNIASSVAVALSFLRLK